VADVTRIQRHAAKHAFKHRGPVIVRDGDTLATAYPHPREKGRAVVDVLPPCSSAAVARRAEQYAPRLDLGLSPVRTVQHAAMLAEAAQWAAERRCRRVRW